MVAIINIFSRHDLRIKKCHKTDPNIFDIIYLRMVYIPKH